MTFPAIAATAVSEETVNTTSFTVDLPSGISAGDLLLVCLATGNEPTMTFPAGWVQQIAEVDGTRHLFVYSLIATGSEGASITVTPSGSTHMAAVVFRLAASGIGYVIHAASGANGAGSPSVFPDPANLDTGAGGRDRLWFALCMHSRITNNVLAIPTNYGNQLDKDGGTGNADSGTLAMVTSRRELNAAAENPGTYTIGGGGSVVAWAAGTIAISEAFIAIGGSRMLILQ